LEAEKKLKPSTPIPPSTKANAEKDKNEKNKITKTPDPQKDKKAKVPDPPTDVKDKNVKVQESVKTKRNKTYKKFH